ncbi:TetR/AcrR family transcriptional regulator [Bacillus sp. REN3]|uniref:TetR/AcrR family transcriptional regulator n=1 Tax=Bacillus sp. REN3 TaxID=2802440 RepID=UPI001AEF1F22|nr:TetR/AcrR family transcriptional regulator [Bacillus sp. REN3]
MSSKFLNLNPEKQERILNAAMQEFAQKGYANASTNEIVKQAGISKGLLFHYFKNKKQLYLFLFNHFVEVLMEEFFEEMDFSERDIFERLKNIMILKTRVTTKYPEVFNFMMSAHLEQAADIKDELDNSTAEMLQSSYSRIFENIDVSRFREGIDLPRTFNIIMWTLEGFSNQAIEKAKQLKNGRWDFDEAFKEAEIYVEMLKDSFYKE